LSARTPASERTQVIMSTRRILAMALASALVVGSVPRTSAAGQETGTISGKATSEAQRPYSNYLVQLRDPATAQVVKTAQLNDQGLFNFTALPLSQRYVVELLNVRENRVVCTEGPYVLSPAVRARQNIDVNCGTNPAAWWLLVAGAGAAAGVAVLTASGG
jgi:hypothetical protein